MRKRGRIPLAAAAKVAVVCPSTIRSWIYKKRVDAIKHAHGWWVNEKSLRAALSPGVRG